VVGIPNLVKVDEEVLREISLTGEAWNYKILVIMPNYKLHTRFIDINRSREH
jgi:hypothetical protein